MSRTLTSGLRHRFSRRNDAGKWGLESDDELEEPVVFKASALR